MVEDLALQSSLASDNLAAGGACLAERALKALSNTALLAQRTDNIQPDLVFLTCTSHTCHKYEKMGPWGNQVQQI